jgi:hypothetical protein
MEPALMNPSLRDPFGRFVIHSLGEVLGQDGLSRVALQAGCSAALSRVTAPSRESDLSYETLGSLEGAIDEIYGIQVGRGLSQLAGRLSLRQGLRALARDPRALDELGAVRVLPLSRRISRGAELFSGLLNRFTDQHIRIERNHDHLLWIVELCPHCWGRNTSEPCCHMALGSLQEGLAWISGGKHFQVDETACRARGDPACTFSLRLRPFAS